MKYAPLLALALLLNSQAIAQESLIENEMTEKRNFRIKGLVFIERMKGHRLYHYQLFDTTKMLVLDKRMKYVPDLRPFNEAFPKVARARDWGTAIAGIFRPAVEWGAGILFGLKRNF